jgi:ABC-2 type transport system ATP-binding protein
VTERLDGHVDSRFTIDPDHLDDIVGRLHAATIHTLTVKPPSLGALFLRSYGDDIEQPGGATAEAAAEKDASGPRRGRRNR